MLGVQVLVPAYPLSGTEGCDIGLSATLSTRRPCDSGVNYLPQLILRLLMCVAGTLGCPPENGRTECVSIAGGLGALLPWVWGVVLIDDFFIAVLLRVTCAGLGHFPGPFVTLSHVDPLETARAFPWQEV